MRPGSLHGKVRPLFRSTLRKQITKAALVRPPRLSTKGTVKNEMPSAYGFPIASGTQGALFGLSGNALRDRRQTIGPWEAELRKDSPYVCIRGQVLNLQESLDEVAHSAHDAAEELLDIVAVQERACLLVVEPHDNFSWRAGPVGLKVQLTKSIMFFPRSNIDAYVTNAEGQVVPNPRSLPAQHYFAYRYFRYSQAAQNIFDGYRNMFLALESLLDHVEPKQSQEGETEWLERA